MTEERESREAATMVADTDPESRAADGAGEDPEAADAEGGVPEAEFAADTADEDQESAAEAIARESAEDEAASKPESKPGPGADLSDEELLRAVSALVFASPEPLTTGRLVQHLQRPPGARVREALLALAERLEGSGLGLELRSIAGGWQILSTPDMGGTVARLFKDRKIERVTPAALETLSIVAYRQPVTKADIEAIRGVQVGPILRNLVDRGLVKVTGRADVPGHPLMYGTTRQFLERFGLASLDELPRDGELARD